MFELWYNHGEETFRDYKKFLKHLIMMIPSKEYGTLFWNLMTQMEQNILNLETFKSQLRTYYKKEINTQSSISSNKNKLLKSTRKMGTITRSTTQSMDLQ